MQVIWQSLLKAIREDKLDNQLGKGFDCKMINGRALGEALGHSLGWLYGQAQTQGVFKSVAVAADSNKLT